MTPAPSPDSMDPSGPVLTNPPATPTAAPAAPQGVSGTVVAVVAAVAVAALVVSGMLWQRLGHTQEQLARQTAEAQAQAIEARTVAREAQDRSGLAIRKIVRQLRPLRSATIAINGTRQTFEPEINDTDRALLDALHGRRSRH